MCNDLDPSDVILQGTGVLSMFGRCKALGPNTKLQTQISFTSNRTDKNFIPNVTMHYDCCEHLGSKLMLNTMKLKNILGHSNAFKYAGHSVDQVERLIIHNEADSEALLATCCGSSKFRSFVLEYLVSQVRGKFASWFEIMRMVILSRQEIRCYMPWGAISHVG
jgi:hypothetical protein